MIIPQMAETDELDDEDIDDDEEYIDLERISGEIGDGKLTADDGVKGAFGNNIRTQRDRSVKFGAGDLHMPDFKKMIGNERPQDTMNDPFDSSWVRSWGKRDQMEAKQRRLADMIVGMDRIQDPVPKTLAPSLGFETQKMLEKMNSKLGIRRLMTESNNYETLIEENFDLDFEPEKDDE